MLKSWFIYKVKELIRNNTRNHYEIRIYDECENIYSEEHTAKTDEHYKERVVVEYYYSEKSYIEVLYEFDKYGFQARIREVQSDELNILDFKAFFDKVFQIVNNTQQDIKVIFELNSPYSYGSVLKD